MEAQLVDEQKSFAQENPFAASDSHYARFRERLDSQEVRRMQHSDLEKVIALEGYELMRLLYQDHLLLRASFEGDARAHGPVVGSDGVERRYWRSDTERGMMTPFGQVGVERAGYSAPGSGSLYPLDVELNLPDDYFSHGMRERVARESAKNWFSCTFSGPKADS